MYYFHCGNFISFFYILYLCLSNLNKENKEVYVVGDLNIDLLKYESNPKHQESYNLVTANCFLPQIFQPNHTRRFYYDSY